MTVDVVICAHDEEVTVGAIVSAVREAPSSGVVLVVADSCTDRTEELAGAAGATVVCGEFRDKGSAMERGLREVTTRTVAFVDADLCGLTAEHIERLLTLPPHPGMVVGLRDGHPLPFGRLPSISGERRMPAAFAAEVGLRGAGWEAELRINAACQRAGLSWGHFVMTGVTNPRRNKPEEWAQVAGGILRHSGPLARMILRTRKVPGA